MTENSILTIEQAAEFLGIIERLLSSDQSCGAQITIGNGPIDTQKLCSFITGSSCSVRQQHDG